MPLPTLDSEISSPTGAPVPTVDWHRLVGYRRAFFGDGFENALRLGRATQDIGGFTLPGQSVTLITSPDLAHEVLVTQADAFQSLHTATGVFGQTFLRDALLFHSRGEAHRRQRKLLAPALGARRIAAFAADMALCAQGIADSWKPGTTVDLLHEMERLQLRILGRLVFDRDMAAEDDFAQAQQTVMRLAFAPRARLRASFGLNTGRRRRARQAIALMQAEIARMIAERRADGADQGDVLSLLLRARYEDGGAMTDAQVSGEVMTLYLAGYENVAAPLTWAWYLLLTHPDCHARLCAEAETVLGGRLPGADDLPFLPYARQVFEEAMRLYPPVSLIYRRAVRDTAIGGFRIPKDTLVWVHVLGMQRRPDLFPSPERFDPDRFAPSARRTMPGRAYLPFGDGPRLCPGSHLALMEGPLLLATMVPRVRLSLLPRQRIEPLAEGILRPKFGIRVFMDR